MAFLVEDGTGIEGATSYASEDDADTYWEDRNNTDWTGTDKEAALIRATHSLDYMYRGRFPGLKTNGRAQSLEWPRSEAYDAEDEEIAEDEIPQEIIDATCELALRELIEAGSTMPDLDRGGHIRRVKAGSVEVEYAGGATATTTYSKVDGILAGLLGTAPASFMATSDRG
jgi:hypothetical protein